MRKLRPFLASFALYCMFFAATAKCALGFGAATARYGTIGVVAIVAIMIGIAALLVARTKTLISQRIPGEIAGAVAAAVAAPLAWLALRLA